VRVQVTLVGLSRSPAAKQREFAAELVKQLQELAGALAARPANALAPGIARGAKLTRTAWTAVYTLITYSAFGSEVRKYVDSMLSR